MSLLLDALKRAEQAKRASGELPPDPPALDPLNFDQQTPAPSANETSAPHVLITRDRLPDISQSLEILADDLPPPLRGRRTTDSRTESSLGTPPNAPGAARAQAAARRLFEAKTPASNPKTPFYIVCSGLAVAALACVAYFWYQLQPHTTRIVAAKASSVPAKVVTAPVQTSAPLSGAPMVGGSSAEMIVPPLQAQAAIQPRRVVTEIEPPSATGVTVERPRSSPPVANTGPTFSKGSAVGLSLTEQAYAAFERGDLNAAHDNYQAALAQDPRNRDALLGLASLDARNGRYESAEARYLKALEADPRNPHAQAGLIALRGQTDPVASENRLKNLLAQQPDSGFLNFALGNQYAAQNRWSDAQQAYFKAYVAEPSSADYMFNLAVSLDHMRQAKAAADYYRKALNAAPAQRVNFNRAQVETRLRELAQ